MVVVISATNLRLDCQFHLLVTQPEFLWRKINHTYHLNAMVSSTIDNWKSMQIKEYFSLDRWTTKRTSRVLESTEYPPSIPWTQGSSRPSSLASGSWSGWSRSAPYAPDRKSHIRWFGPYKNKANNSVHNKASHLTSTIKFKKSMWLCRSFVRSRLWYVLDRQLLNGWSHRHQNRRLCSRPHSNESVIFSNFWD